MAGILSESQIADIIDAFNAVDDDRDGIIPSSKLGAVLKRLGENPTDADVQVPRVIIRSLTVIKLFNSYFLLRCFSPDDGRST